MADAAGTSGQHGATTLHLGNFILGDYGRLVCWDKHNSGFFLLLWYLRTLLGGCTQTPLMNTSADRFTAALFTKTRVVKLRLRSPLSGTAHSFTRMPKLTTCCLITSYPCIMYAYPILSSLPCGTTGLPWTTNWSIVSMASLYRSQWMSTAFSWITSGWRLL